MPRTITLHPLSLLLGIAFALIGVMAMGQMPVPNRPPASHSLGGQGLANPADWVQVREGSPYTVPGGKRLALTGINTSNSANTEWVEVFFDGTFACEAQRLYLVGGFADIPPGIQAGPGTVVTIVKSSIGGLASALGYLVDA